MFGVLSALALQGAVLAIAVWSMRRASERDPPRLKSCNTDAVNVMLFTNATMALMGIAACLFLHREPSTAIGMFLSSAALSVLMLGVSFVPPAQVWFEEEPITG